MYDRKYKLKNFKVNLDTFLRCINTVDGKVKER